MSPPPAARNGRPATAAASLYSSAMCARNKYSSMDQSSKPAPDPVLRESPRPPATVHPPQYLVSEQQKAAFRRYGDATQAAHDTPSPGYTHGETDEDTTPHESSVASDTPLLPSAPSGPSPGFSTAPSPSGPGAVTGTPGRRLPPHPPPHVSGRAVEGSASGPENQRILTAAEEKALLRAKYEAREAHVNGAGSDRSNSVSPA